jgi:hypothetical protein
MICALVSLLSSNNNNNNNNNSTLLVLLLQDPLPHKPWLQAPTEFLSTSPMVFLSTVVVANNSVTDRPNVPTLLALAQLLLLPLLAPPRSARRPLHSLKETFSNNNNNKVSRHPCLAKVLVRCPLAPPTLALISALSPQGRTLNLNNTTTIINNSTKCRRLHHHLLLLLLLLIIIIITITSLIIIIKRTITTNTNTILNNHNNNNNNMSTTINLLTVINIQRTTPNTAV